MKNPTLITAARLAALAALLGLSACSGVSATGSAPPTPAPGAATPGAPKPGAPTPGAPTPGAPASTQGMWQKIQAEIGAAACDDATQCRTMPVGHKSCGGPESYVAYSTKTGDATRLLAMGTQYAQARKAENQDSGRVSNCLLVTDPGATCAANRCILMKGGAGVSTQ